MTRIELERELERVDRFIEVLQGLISKPLCECLPQLSHFNEAFKKENKKQLQDLIGVKNKLIQLKHKSDDALTSISHPHVKYY
ncbi:MAG: hypothetical protein U9O64_08650 [Campylobacterota bacterium]|nr:hypothetical protein [Campylobacterota bacterium]